LLSTLKQHANIIQVKGLGALDEEVGMVMEYVHGTPANKAMDQLTQAYKNNEISHRQFWGAVQYTLKGVLSGLSHIAEASYAHQDLKLENVMVRDNGQIVLLDFGLARKYGASEELSTFGYNTPEFFKQQAENTRAIVSSSTDSYALGQILYELTSGLASDDKNIFWAWSGLNKHSELMAHRVLCDAMRLYSDNKQAFPMAVDPSIQTGDSEPDLLIPEDVPATVQGNHRRSGGKIGRYQVRSNSALIDFINSALESDPEKRKKATDLLDHPFLSDPIYESEEQVQNFLTGFFDAKG